MSKHIRQGDKVVIIAGNDKGKIGKVISRNEEKVIVEGVNVRKKHARKTQTAPGSIIDKTMPVHVSNVQIVSDAGRPVKLKVRCNAQKEKELIYLENNKEILFRAVKSSK